MSSQVSTAQKHKVGHIGDSKLPLGVKRSVTGITSTLYSHLMVCVPWIHHSPVSQRLHSSRVFFLNKGALGNISHKDKASNRLFGHTLPFPSFKSVCSSHISLNNPLPVFVIAQQHQCFQAMLEEMLDLCLYGLADTYMIHDKGRGYSNCKQWRHLHHWTSSSNFSEWVRRKKPQVKAAVVLGQRLSTFFSNVHLGWRVPAALRSAEIAPWCHSYSVSFVLGWRVWHWYGHGINGMFREAAGCDRSLFYYL